MAVAFCTY